MSINNCYIFILTNVSELEVYFTTYSSLFTTKAEYMRVTNFVNKAILQEELLENLGII